MIKKRKGSDNDDQNKKSSNRAEDQQSKWAVRSEEAFVTPDRAVCGSLSWNPSQEKQTNKKINTNKIRKIRLAFVKPFNKNKNKQKTEENINKQCLNQSDKAKRTSMALKLSYCSQHQTNPDNYQIDTRQTRQTDSHKHKSLTQKMKTKKETWG